MSDVGSLHGRIILVTGSNAGIGYATAQLLADKGARLILACRNPQKGEQALSKLRSAVPTAEFELLLLDLANLASVREFAATVQARYERLDVLVNNAGLMMPPLGRTADGFELQFGTNVLGHFALTGLLLPLLEHAPAARIVTLSSLAHWVGRIAFDNLNAERGYSSVGAYAQSKLADMMFAYELQRRLQRTRSPAISLAAHPGGTRSDLGRHRLLLRMIASFAQSTEDGALPSIRAAVDPAALGGEYYGPAKLLTIAGPPVKQRSSRRSHDQVVAARLWETSEQLTGVRYLS